MGFLRQEHWSGCHSLLQGIFLTQGSNLGLLQYRQSLYHLSHNAYNICEFNQPMLDQAGAGKCRYPPRVAVG